MFSDLIISAGVMVSNLSNVTYVSIVMQDNQIVLIRGAEFIGESIKLRTGSFELK